MKIKRKRLSLILKIFWGLLIIAVFLLLFKNHLPSLSGLFKRLRREPARVVSVFKPRSMLGFRCDFSRAGDFEYWKTNGTRLERVDSLLGAGDSWAKVTFLPTATPGFLWTDETMGITDWRAVDSFHFSTYNPQSWDISLKLKIKDVSGRMYQKDLTLPPYQFSRFSIPIRTLASRLDVSRVAYCNFFIWKPATETVLYFTDLEFSSRDRPAAGTAAVNFTGLQFPTRVTAGEEIEAEFYFILNDRLRDDNTLLVSLRRDGNVYELLKMLPPYPTSKWRPKRLRKVGPVTVRIPSTLPPGKYDLEVILLRLVPSGRPPILQPYGNIDGHTVEEITVTSPDDR